MKRLFRINLKTAIPLISVIALFHCEKRVPTDLQIFRSWFINPSEKVDTRLTSFTEETIDSLVKNIRKHSATGTLAETLYDSSNTAYVLGYKTPPHINPDTVYPLIDHGSTENSKYQRSTCLKYLLLLPTAATISGQPVCKFSARWWSSECQEYCKLFAL